MAALALEVARVVRVLSAVENDRIRCGTAAAVERARARGTASQARTREQRVVLRRAIGIVDSRSGASNCFRRALLEMSLDAGSAREVLFLELNDSSAAESSHARLESWPSDGRVFDATISL